MEQAGAGAVWFWCGIPSEPSILASARRTATPGCVEPVAYAILGNARDVLIQRATVPAVLRHGCTRSRNQDSARRTRSKVRTTAADAATPVSVPSPGDAQFLGKIRDESTGLTQIGARYYDELVGSFISVDPLLDLADPQ